MNERPTSDDDDLSDSLAKAIADDPVSKAAVWDKGYSLVAAARHPVGTGGQDRQHLRVSPAPHLNAPP
jgi:hypothetical protein